MSTLKLNNLGELDVEGNDITYFAPVTNFTNESVTTGKLEHDYSNFIDKLNYNDLLAPINEITAEGKYIQFKYHLESSSFYYTIRNLDFEQQLQYFRSLVEIAKIQKSYNIQILWQVENFILSTEENDEKIRALVYDFSDDMKVYDRTTALQGLKKIILCGLTKRNKILAKPNKADFINKNQDIIDFAELVLEAQTIEEIEEKITNRIEVIEQNKEREQQRLEEEQNNKSNSKIFFFKKNKKPKTLKKESPKDVIKSNLQRNYNGENKNSKKKDFSVNGLKNLMFKDGKSTIISLIIIFFIMFIIMIMPSVSQSSEKDKEQKIQDEKINKKITSLYRDYIDGNKQKAHQKMFAIDYKKVPNKKDKDIYLKWLVEDEKYTKALDLNKNVAYTIGENINDKNIDQLKKINSNDNYKVLSFFIAKHDKDFQTMIEMQNSVDLKRKDVANNLAQSYILTNQKSELDSLVKKIEKKKDSSSAEYKNLNTAKQYYEDQNDELQDLRKDRDKAKEEVKDLQKSYEKSDKKGKKSKKKDLDRSRDKLNNAEKRYDKAYKDILNTKLEDAIPSDN
ncbi:hypothetical protein BUY99_05240 [Staphylococcus gallinarum]|uniref:hypothetical protein n=1 Tax=Staphylococcus gallinarum TaxID=1293 RepID=UPI000E67B33A|nr:hypothetical protein [Staphylococcus gallinarum]RIL23394.1 hypothetical protein BUY99_05240 [Staphylococcus gallinarum]